MRHSVPFTGLETEQFVLRQLSLQDAGEIFALRSDKEINQLIGRATATSIDEAITHIQKIISLQHTGESYFWVISHKAQSKLIGTILFYNIDEENATAEIGYELLPAYHAKGVMQQALPCVLAFGFSVLQLKSIIADVNADNVRSLSLLQKFNFRPVPNQEQLSGYMLYSLPNPYVADRTVG